MPRQQNHIWKTLSVAATLPAVFALAGVFSSTATHAETIYKRNNDTKFAENSSWIGRRAPNANDVAAFDYRFTFGGTNIGTGGAVGWGGLRILNPGGGKVTINNTVASSYVGVYSGGVDMSAATRNLSIESFRQLANHTWSIASGRTFFVGNTYFNQGSYAVSLAGGGTVNFYGSSLALGQSSTFSGTLSMGSAGLVLSAGSGSSLSIGGSVITSGGLTKTGTGTYTVNGNNTFGSGVNIAAGTLALGSASALGTQGALTFSGGTLRFTSANRGDYSSRFSTANGQQYRLDTNGQSVSLGSTIRSTSSLTKTGSGTLTLSATNTYTGATTVSAGTLNVTGKIGNGSYAGTIANAGSLVFNQAANQTLSGVLSGGGSLTKAGSGTLTLSATNTYSGTTTLSGGTLNVTGRLGNGSYAGTIANAGSLVFNQAANQTLSGVLSGAGSLIKAGSGTLTLSATNTYTGATTVSAGTLNVTGRLGNGSYAGTIANAGSLVFNQTANQTLSGVLSGAGSLTKAGSGRLTLTGANTGYTGDVTISGGTLVLDNDDAFTDNVSITLTSGAHLVVNPGHTVSVDVFTLESGRLSGAGTLEAVTTEVDAATIEAPIRDARGRKSGFVKRGTGTTTVQAANTFTGTLDIRGGTVRLGTGGSFAAEAALALTTGATLELAGASQSFAGLSGDAGVISLGTGALQITGDGSFGGDITGSGSLTKGGSGNLILTGANTYGGGTTVSGGRLSVNGSLSDTLVTITDGELGGSGSITGVVSIAGGASLSPGNSIQSLETGATTFASGALFEYEVDSTDLDNLATAADLLVVNGDLTITEGSLLSFADIGTQPGEFVQDTTVFAMINYTGGWNGGEFTLNGQLLTDDSQFFVDSQMWQIDYNATGGGLNYTSDYQPGSNFVTVTAVPEPSTFVMLALAVTAASCGVAKRRFQRLHA